eukprot:tig00021582_g22639.t1
MIQQFGPGVLARLAGALGEFEESLAVWDDVVDVGYDYADVLDRPATPPRTPPRREGRSVSVGSRRESKRLRRAGAAFEGDASGEEDAQAGRARPSTGRRRSRSRSPPPGRPMTAPGQGERGTAPGPGAYEPQYAVVSRRVYAGTFGRAPRAAPFKKDEESGEASQREGAGRPRRAEGDDVDTTMVRADAYTRRRPPTATFAPLPTPVVPPLALAEGLSAAAAAAAAAAAERLQFRVEEHQRKLGPGAYEPRYEGVRPRNPAAVIAPPPQPAPPPRRHRYAPDSDDSDLEFIDLERSPSPPARPPRPGPAPTTPGLFAEGDRLLLDAAAADAALRPRRPSARLAPAPAPRTQAWEPPRLFYDVNLDAVRPSASVSVPDLARSSVRFPSRAKEEEAALGPGAYEAGAAAAALEPDAPAARFGRSSSMRFDYPADGSLPPKPPPRDGDRIPIRPSLSLVRPSVPAALIAPEPSNAPPPALPERYRDAPYEPNLDAARPRPPGSTPLVEFAKMLPRGDPAPAPEEAQTPLDVRYSAVEAAGPAYTGGDALDLDAARAAEALAPRRGAAVEMARQVPRPDPTPKPQRRDVVYRVEEADALPPGPGRYRPDDAAARPRAPAADFARASARFPEGAAGPAEGDLLVLEAAAAADAVRPSAPAALIAPEPSNAPPPALPERYRDAPYEPNLDAVRPGAPGPVPFERQTERDELPAQADSGVDGFRYRPSRRLVEASVRSVPDLARQSDTGRLAPPAPSEGGDALDLDPARGEALVAPRRSAGPLEFARQTARPGLPGALAAAPDADYDPKEDLVRPRAPAAVISAPPDPEEAARREEERAREQPPGPGRYRPDPAAVLPAPPSMRAREGDVLLLEPSDEATRPAAPAPPDFARQLPRPASGLARASFYEDTPLDPRDDALRPAMPAPLMARHRARPRQLFEAAGEGADALLYHPERGYAAVEPALPAVDFGARVSRQDLERAEARGRGEVPDGLLYRPSYSQTLPSLRGAPEFERQAGRPEAEAALEEGQELKYEPRLSLVKPRTDASVPDFARLPGRPEPPPAAEEGSELKYDPEVPRHVPGPSMALATGRPAEGGPLGAKKAEEGSELKYDPRPEAVLPRAPGAPAFRTALGREDLPAPEAEEGQELKYEPRLSLVKPRTDVSVPDLSRSAARDGGALAPRELEEGQELKYDVRREAVEPRASRGGALPLDRQMGREDLPQPEPAEGQELKYDPTVRRSVKGFVEMELQIARPEPGPDPDRVLEGSEFKYQPTVPARDASGSLIDFDRQTARKERKVEGGAGGETMLAHGDGLIDCPCRGPEFGLLVPREGTSETARFAAEEMRARGEERRSADAAARADPDNYQSLMRVDERRAGPVSGREEDVAGAAVAAGAAVQAAWAKKLRRKAAGRPAEEGAAAGAAPVATWHLRARKSTEGEAAAGAPSPRSSGEGSACWLTGNPATGAGVRASPGGGEGGGKKTLRVVMPAAPAPVRPLAAARASAAATAGLAVIPEEP